MKNKSKIYLKIALGVLMVALIVCVGIFIWPEKKVDKKVNSDSLEMVSRDDKMFLGKSYAAWDSIAFAYFRQTLGYEPSICYEEEKNGTLVLTFKNYDSSIDRNNAIDIDVITVDSRGVMTNSKGEEIYEKGEEPDEILEDVEYYDYEENE